MLEVSDRFEASCISHLAANYVTHRYTHRFEEILHRAWRRSCASLHTIKFLWLTNPGCYLEWGKLAHVAGDQYEFITSHRRRFWINIDATYAQLFHLRVPENEVPDSFLCNLPRTCIEPKEHISSYLSLSESSIWERTSSEMEEPGPPTLRDWSVGMFLIRVITP